jgi:hypothetical protein
MEGLGCGVDELIVKTLSNKKIIIALTVLLFALIAAGMLLPALAKTTNCGRNSAVLSVCNTCGMELYLASDDLGRRYDITQLSDSCKIELAKLASNHWISEAKFFVRTNITLNDTQKLIWVVCDTPFENVPQPTIWNGYRKNPAHAVGFSDGTTGLIKPAEFKKLNLAEFIDAATLPPNNVSTNSNTAL